MERKGIATSSKMFGDASSNAGVHFQSEVNFVHHVSIVSRSRLPALPFLLRFDFGPFTSFGYPLCLSASMHTILSKSIDLLVLRANGY